MIPKEVKSDKRDRPMSVKKNTKDKDAKSESNPEEFLKKRKTAKTQQKEDMTKFMSKNPDALTQILDGKTLNTHTIKTTAQQNQNTHKPDSKERKRIECSQLFDKKEDELAEYLFKETIGKGNKNIEQFFAPIKGQSYNLALKSKDFLIETLSSLLLNFPVLEIICYCSMTEFNYLILIDIFGNKNLRGSVYHMDHMVLQALQLLMKKDAFMSVDREIRISKDVKYAMFRYNEIGVKYVDRWFLFSSFVSYFVSCVCEIAEREYQGKAIVIWIELLYHATSAVINKNTNKMFETDFKKCLNLCSELKKSITENTNPSHINERVSRAISKM